MRDFHGTLASLLLENGHSDCPDSKHTGHEEPSSLLQGVERSLSKHDILGIKHPGIPSSTSNFTQKIKNDTLYQLSLFILGNKMMVGLMFIISLSCQHHSYPKQSMKQLDQSVVPISQLIYILYLIVMKRFLMSKYSFILYPFFFQMFNKKHINSVKIKYIFSGTIEDTLYFQSSS